MNLHQFCFVREAVRQKFNLTKAARALHISQPGVSKVIIELEEELGVDIFTHHGRRIRGLTEPGWRILASVERVLEEVETFKYVGRNYAARDQGNFIAATTYTQARYASPKAITEFTRRYPKVRLSIQQGTPARIAEMVLRDQADLTITTEGVLYMKDLISIPGHQWQYVVVTLSDRPFLSRQHLTLNDLKGYPITTHDHHFAGRLKIDHMSELCQIKLDIVFEVIDADVVKTYVEMDLGVGTVAGAAFNTECDRNLRTAPAGRLFDTNVTYLGIK